MNQSAVQAIGGVNGWEGQYRPVWASSFRTVKVKGKPVYFRTALAAEVAAWRVLYAVEQRVMKRDGETVFSAKSAAEKLFRSGRVINVETIGEGA